MNFLHKYIDSNVYKTNSIIHEDNNNVQNKDCNVHVRLLRKARKYKKAVNDLLTTAIELLELCIAFLSRAIYILSIPQDNFILPEKDTNVWDVCLNAFGRGY